MKKSFLVLVTLALSQPASAQLGGWLRSLSGAVGGGSERTTASGAATIGVRGYLGDELKKASPDFEGMKTLSKIRSNRQDASNEARKNKLETREIKLGEPTPAADSGETP